MRSSGTGTAALTGGKSKGGFAIVLLAVALLASHAWPQPTQNLDVIWTIPTPSTSSPYLTPPLVCFGASLASGDLDGDGVSDAIVAGDTYDENHGTTPMSGRVYVYYGSHVGATAPDLVLRSPVWVGSNTPNLACGDLNGDGYDDIAMGEDCADNALGICTIWLGGNPVDTTPAFVIHGGFWWLQAHFGSDVTIGDLDGDGYGDLAVGAYFTAEQPGHDGTGRVYVFYGGPSLDTIPGLTLSGGHEGDVEEFGTAVSAVGDFDHDGFHDLYVGASQFGDDMRGRMYAYHGGNPMDTSYDMAMSGEGPAQFLGDTKPGFLRRQGIFDYGVEGNPLWPYGFFSPNNCGKVYIHHGGRPMDSIPDVCLIGRQDSAYLGMSAQSAGDASGDGDDDLAVGAPLLPAYYTGAAYLWQTGAHFDTVPDAWMTGATREQLIGYVVSSAGDLDGDGRDEFMVSNYPAGDYVPKNVWVCKYTGSGVEETPSAEVRTTRTGPTVVRGVLFLPKSPNPSTSLLDIGGRKVMELHAGANDVQYLAPGVYFLRSRQSAVSRKPSAFTKIVIAR